MQMDQDSCNVLGHQERKRTPLALSEARLCGRRWLDSGFAERAKRFWTSAVAAAGRYQNEVTNVSTSSISLLRRRR
jgi:hypothetical protein